jgi:transcriptional regulator with XRE-family HTH domain
MDDIAVTDMTVSIPRQAGIYVRRERESQGRTRAQLARTAHVSERLLASLELGEAPGIQLDKLLAVCGALGLELCLRATGVPAQDEAPAQQASVPSTQPASDYDAAWQEFMAAQGIVLTDASDADERRVD